MKSWIWQLFSDGEMLSWMRVFGAIILMVGAAGFSYSFVNRYDAGLLASATLIGSVLTLKGYQTKKETEFNSIVEAKKE